MIVFGILGRPFSEGLNPQNLVTYTTSSSWGFKARWALRLMSVPLNLAGGCVNSMQMVELA